MATAEQDLIAMEMLAFSSNLSRNKNDTVNRNFSVVKL